MNNTICDMIKFIKLFIWDLFHKTEYHEAFSRSIISIDEKTICEYMLLKADLSK